ncbi:MAG: hypothetical protein AB8B48_20025 [Pseudomonadales bacterium]
MKLLILGLVAVLGNATVAANAALSVEVLHSIRVEADILHFSVTSHGCTRAGDFQLLNVSQSPLRLSVIRIKQDRCRKAPSLIELSIPLNNTDEYTVKRFELLNPLQPFAGMSRR